MPQVIHTCTYLQRTFCLPLDPAGYGCRLFHRLTYKRENLIGAVGTQYEATVVYFPTGVRVASFTYNLPNPPATVTIPVVDGASSSFNGPNQLVVIYNQGGEAALRDTYTVSDPVDMARPVERASSLVDQVNLDNYQKPTGIDFIRSYANPFSNLIENVTVNGPDYNRDPFLPSEADATFQPGITFRGVYGYRGLFSNNSIFAQSDPQSPSELGIEMPYASAGSGLILSDPLWYQIIPDERSKVIVDFSRFSLSAGALGPDLVGRYVRSKIWPFRNWCLTTWPADGFGRETCIPRNMIQTGNCSTRSDTGGMIILPGSEGDWKVASDTRLFYNAFNPAIGVDTPCTRASRCA